jgi:hypothetical protein
MSKVELKAEQKKPQNTKTTNSTNKQDKTNQNKNPNTRIIQKQLVYVIGLSSEIAFKDVK